jgi:hypothetical protein
MKTISYEFDPPTVDLILRGLGKLPHEEVAGVINQILAHARATMNPPAKPKRKPKPHLAAVPGA